MPLTKKSRSTAKSRTRKKTTARSKSTRQTGVAGKRSLSDDKKRKAKKPGWRKAASGRWYSERRGNRSDKSRVTRL